MSGAPDGFPLTARFLGAAAPRAASADEFVRAVCDAHPRGDIPSRAARDLVRYEAARLALPPKAPEPGPMPGDDDPCVLAPHVRLVFFGADLPGIVEALRAGRPAKPRPARGWVLLWPGGEEVITRDDGWFLESFRTATRLSDTMWGTQARPLFAKLWNAGVLARA